MTAEGQADFFLLYHACKTVLPAAEYLRCISKVALRMLKVPTRL